MKGAITITSEELNRMKMKANLLPNRKYPLSQPIQKTVIPSINFSRAKNVPINGQITINILSKGKKNRDLKSSKNNSLNADALTSRKENSN